MTTFLWVLCFTNSYSLNTINACEMSIIITAPQIRYG